MQAATLGLLSVLWTCAVITLPVSAMRNRTETSPCRSSPPSHLDNSRVWTAATRSTTAWVSCGGDASATGGVAGVAGGDAAGAAATPDGEGDGAAGAAAGAAGASLLPGSVASNVFVGSV